VTDAGRSVGSRAELVCPHCKKPFSAELLAGDSRYRGFKCPHCRLFIPAARAVDE
jgi:DNA-directed RNA polymerase subunit RPC12/RpoP